MSGLESGEGRIPVVSASGRMLDWHRPGWGTTRHNVEQSFATFEVSSVGGERPSGAPSSPMSVARAVLAGAAFMPGCDALELRYIATPDNSGVARVQMYATTKSCQPYGGQELAAAAARAAVSLLPPDFTREAVSRYWMEAQPGRDEPIFELRRAEEITFPQWEYIPADFYYQITDVPGDGSGWKRFWHSLSRVTTTVTISLLFKQTEIDPIERDVLGAILTQLGLFAETRRDVDMLGYDTIYPACENAALALTSWQDRLRYLQRPLLARVAVRGELTTTMPIATALAGAIAASGRDRSTQPMFVETPVESSDHVAAREGFDWLEIYPWGGPALWQLPEAPHSLRRFPYLYGLDEAAGLAVLPVPDEQGVPGFARARRIAPRRATWTASPSEPEVMLGDLMHEGVPAAPIGLPLTAINKHALVVGTPGSGKTTTVLTMLAALWRDYRVPFLVIEPTKTEYRTLLNVSGVENLRVLSLGRDDVAPLRFNPLAPPPGVRCEVHANAILAALKAALPLPPPLPQLLEESIERAYRRTGWDYDTIIDEGLSPPSLRTVMACFEDTFEEANYVGDARNVASAMRVRLKSLVRGSRGRVLDTVESTDFDALLARPVVIELDEVSDPDDKSIMASFILDRVRAGARRKGSSGGRLRHVTVIEEAHRLLARVVPTVSSEGENSRAVGVEAFCNAIAELRSVGESFVVSSQSPSRLAAAAIDNCAARILHNIESAADRDTVLSDLGASDLEREAAARLRVGEAIVRWPGLEEPEFIQVVPGEGIDSGAVVTDEEVRQRMAEETASVRKLLPYPLCTRDVCKSGCDPSVRAAGEAIAVELQTSAAKSWKEHDESIAALAPIVRQLHSEAAGDTQTAYCGAAHLGAFGHALSVRRRIDIGPKILAGIEGAGS